MGEEIRPVTGESPSDQDDAHRASSKSDSPPSSLSTSSSPSASSISSSSAQIGGGVGDGLNRNNDKETIKPNNKNNNSCNMSQTDPERRYRPQKYCAVCGDKAIACNFNAVTCESCKAFFRRNAFKEQRLKCLFDNRCVIDRITRRFCSKCRLLKCFQIGMKREWILTDEQKQIKRVKILQNKQFRQQTTTTTSQKTITNAAASSPQMATPGEQAPSSPQQVARAPQPSFTNGLAMDSADCTIVCHSADNLKPRTRDAATSCRPEEFATSILELEHQPCGISSPVELQHYCTFAQQCQYCASRLGTRLGRTPCHLVPIGGQVRAFYQSSGQSVVVQAELGAVHQPMSPADNFAGALKERQMSPGASCCLDSNQTKPGDQQIPFVSREYATSPPIRQAAVQNLALVQRQPPLSQHITLSAVPAQQQQQQVSTHHLHLMTPSSQQHQSPADNQLASGSSSSLFDSSPAYQFVDCQSIG